MASHKAALQRIAALPFYGEGEDVTGVDFRALAGEAIAIAQDALLDVEAKKQAQDRIRANLAIVKLGHVTANPTSVLTQHCGDCVPDDFMPAVASELARMRGAVAAGPEALREIYRRNESRR